MKEEDSFELFFNALIKEKNERKLIELLANYNEDEEILKLFLIEFGEEK